MPARLPQEDAIHAFPLPSGSSSQTLGNSCPQPKNPTGWRRPHKKSNALYLCGSLIFWAATVLTVLAGSVRFGCTATRTPEFANVLHPSP